MAEAAKDQDQSMEDILQSIKRIIAEEGDAPAESGSDILELTELLAEDGSVSQIDGDKPKVETLSIDEIMAAPISTMPPKAAEPEPAPAPVVAAPEPVVAPAPVPEPVAETPAEPESDAESLISNTTLSASVAALNSLRDSMAPSAAPRSASSSFRSGLTVEDLVLEGLKPMLKDWLDHNLPTLVESLVKKEISKLTQG